MVVEEGAVVTGVTAAVEEASGKILFLYAFHVIAWDSYSDEENV